MVFYIFIHYLSLHAFHHYVTSLQIEKNNGRIKLGDKDMAKKKEEISIQARRRLFFVRPFCFVCIMLVLFTFVKYSIDLYHLNNEKKKKEAEYFELQEESEFLRNEVEKLHDPEELAKYAREKFLYSKDGELIIKIEKEEKTEKPDIDKEKEEDMTIIFLCATGFGLIILYLIVKSIINKRKKIVKLD